MSSPPAPSGRVCVIGAGTIGTTVSFALATAGIDVTLVDVDADRTEGHAIDLRHATAHAAHPVGPDAPGGDVCHAPPGPEAVADADCAVFAASAGRPEGTRSRMAFLAANRPVVADVADWLGAADPLPLVVVTNPLDRIVALLYDALGWPRHRLVGYSLSETARLADAIARERGVEPHRVECPVIGEHGDDLVPVFSRARIDGAPADLTAAERERAGEYARSIAYEVIQLRGEADSSRWVTGQGVAWLCRRLLAGGTDRPVGLSTPLDGEFGEHDVSLGVPLTLSTDGVDRIHEWDLAESERAGLAAAADAIRESL